MLIFLLISSITKMNDVHVVDARELQWTLPQWDGYNNDIVREREREREREIERERERERERRVAVGVREIERGGTVGERASETERKGEREGERGGERGRGERGREGQWERDIEREGEGERDRGRERHGERGRGREKEEDRGRGRGGGEREIKFVEKMKQLMALVFPI